MVLSLRDLQFGLKHAKPVLSIGDKPIFLKFGAKMHPCGAPDKTGEYFTRKQVFFCH